MVADVETIDRTPEPAEAAANLAAVADARRAVRDRPWPIWLYPANALALGTMASTPLLPELAALAAWVASGVAIFVLNFWAGHRMGTPFAIPTSREFGVAVATSTLFLVAALVFGYVEGADRLVVGCAVGTALSYAIGSLLHYRSTRR